MPAESETPFDLGNPYVPPRDMSAGSGGPQRSRVRFAVLGVLCMLSGILYLDRVCISSAVDVIQQDLGLTNTQTSYYMNAFALAYGLFEIPTGRWGDKLGARRVLMRIAIWWSLFTALTGACTGLTSLIIVRFLFGAGEAGAFPNVARVMSRWFPDNERGRAQGFLLAASQIGAATAPFLASRLIIDIGWRLTFVAFGSVGVIWAVGFWWWFRDEPSEHPSVNTAEAEHIGRRASAGSVHAPIPWALVLRNPSILMLSAIMAVASFNSYIYFSWYPKYLTSGRSVLPEDAGTMASLALAGAAAGTFFGGWMVDRFVIPNGLRGRRWMGGCSFFAGAVFLGCSLMSQNPWLAAGFAALSCFATQATSPLWWSCAIGISGKHIGALFGLMNSVGVFGAMSSNYLVGAIADWQKSQGLSGRAQWDPIFYIDLAVLALGSLLWFSFLFVSVEPTDADH